MQNRCLNRAYSVPLLPITYFPTSTPQNSNEALSQFAITKVPFQENASHRISMCVSDREKERWRHGCDRTACGEEPNSHVAGAAQGKGNGNPASDRGQPFWNPEPMGPCPVLPAEVCAKPMPIRTPVFCWPSGVLCVGAASFVGPLRGGGVWGTYTSGSVHVRRSASVHELALTRTKERS